jgi:hypothetical protein
VQFNRLKIKPNKPRDIMSHSSVNITTEASNTPLDLNSTVPGREERFYFEKHSDENYLRVEVQKRNGYLEEFGTDHVYSTQFVIQQAALRHFEMMELVVPTMATLFSEQEILLLLNVNCGPIWRWRAGCSLVSDVAGEYGVEDLSDVEEDSDIKLLLIKLLKLDSLQTLALMDLCERYWRNQNYSSLAEGFESMGLVLAE